MYLNCHSSYSIKYGLASVQELVHQARQYGYEQLALTDINNTSGLIEFIGRCREAGIDPIVGIEYRFHGAFYYIGLARNEEGLRGLHELLNTHLVDGRCLPRRAPELPDTCFIYDFAGFYPLEPHDHEYIGVSPDHVHHLYQVQIARRSERMVALCTVTLQDPKDIQTHRLLRAIAQNTTLEKLAKESLCRAGEFMRTPQELHAIFAGYPQLLQNTYRVARQFTGNWERETAPNKTTFLGNPEADRQLLQSLAYKGMQWRYGDQPDAVQTRIGTELELISQLCFATYYLIAWDIVQFARRRHYHHVGRGSGANSIVAYCLGITDVDPVALNLYFERFINPHRPVPPDFDLDFCWHQRDEVLEYVRRKHGPGYVGLLCSYQTFKGRSTVRELGKVLGLNRKEIEVIIREPMALHKHHPVAQQIFSEGRRLLGLPSHLSIHSGGVVIGARPLTYFAASQMMPKGFPVLQIDKNHAEEWGFHKFDLLSQRGIGHIADAVALVREHGKTEVDIHKMPAIVTDAKTLQLIRQPGGCIGCFYIESPAMRGLLAKVQCQTYQDLVAVSSIIRPGVAKSGMMRAFIERFCDPVKRITRQPHPAMERLLEETFGIMVYQEDVMKVVHHIGGFDLYQADLLRRLMTGKSKSVESLDRLRELFFANCAANGLRSQQTEEIWRQIASFSGYAFCKAHSATYAAESLQSAYLKAHYPVEFMVAVINNQGGFYPMGTYVRELQKTGVAVELPCVNQSSWFTRITGGKVYLGLNLVTGLKLQTGEALLQLRHRRGPILRLEMLREVLPPKQIDLLIDIGACRSICKDKSRLFFHREIMQPDQGPGQLPLFTSGSYQHQGDQEFDPSRQQSLSELRLLGFMLASPFSLLQCNISGTILQRQMSGQQQTNVSMIGSYVIEKPVTTQDGKHMCFITWTDAEDNYFDSVHFAPVLHKFPVGGKGLYLLEGQVESGVAYPSLIVNKAECLLNFDLLVEEHFLTRGLEPFIS